MVVKVARRLASRNRRRGRMNTKETAVNNSDQQHDDPDNLDMNQPQKRYSRRGRNRRGGRPRSGYFIEQGKAECH